MIIGLMWAIAVASSIWAFIVTGISVSLFAEIDADRRKPWVLLGIATILGMLGIFLSAWAARM